MSLYEDLHHEALSQEAVAAYITNFEGTSDDNQNDETATEHEPDTEEEDGDQTVQYLTSAVYLHRTTGEDIYGVDANC